MHSVVQNIVNISKLHTFAYYNQHFFFFGKVENEIFLAKKQLYKTKENKKLNSI